jgi:hypothetical protein
LHGYCFSTCSVRLCKNVRRPTPDLPFRRSQQSLAPRPATAAGAPWPRPTARASRRRAPHPSPGSPASLWVWIGSTTSCGPGIGLDFCASVPVVGRPNAREGEQRAVIGDRKPDHVFLLFVPGFGSGAYSAKLLAGTKQRFSGLSQPRQSLKNRAYRTFSTTAAMAFAVSTGRAKRKAMPQQHQ